MKKYAIEDMVDGWFIGDFKPSVLRTKDFEVGIKIHAAGSDWPAHKHNHLVEYNLLLDGCLETCGEVLEPGDIFVIEKGEVSDPIFHDNCVVLTIKVPSIPDDKEIV